MAIREELKVDLNNFMFKQMMSDLNSEIIATIAAMSIHGVADSTINLKIGLSTVGASVVRGVENVRVLLPEINYKIGSKLDIKSEASGKFGEGYALIEDENAGCYYMVPTNEVAGQTEMFTEMDEAEES